MRKYTKKLKKYPDGGTTPTTGGTPANVKIDPATGKGVTVKNFDNIVPLIDPATGLPKWDMYYSTLKQMGNVNIAQGSKQTPIQNSVNYYVGQTIVPQIKTYQGTLNTALANKYGKAFNPATGPTADQYLTPQEGATALGGQPNYQSFLDYTNAYNAYRGQTNIAGTNTAGSNDPQAQMYGARYYNLFTPGYVPANPANTQQPATTTAAPAQGQPLPQQAMGGQFGELLDNAKHLNWNKVGQAFGNYGKLAADTSLSAVGLSNVIQDDMYKGNTANDFQNISHVTSKLSGMALPIAANIALPGSGKFVKMGQQAIGSFNPQENYGGDEQSNGFAEGGMYMGEPNAEVEKKEVLQYPNGSVDQVNGPSHENGGVPVNLPQATRIFSDRLKLKGKTFAKVASKYKTDKDEEILSQATANPAAKKAAELNVMAKNKKLDEIFSIQETMKAKRINSYIKKYGGEQKYPEGGTYGVPTEQEWSQNINPFYTLDPNSMYASQPTDFMRSIEGQYNNTGIPAVSNTSGLPTQEPRASIPSRNINQLPTNYQQATINQTPQTLDQSSSNSPFRMLNEAGKWVTANQDSMKTVGAEAANFGAQNVANLAYLKQQGKRYDNVDYGTVKPNHLSDEASKREIAQSYNLGRYGLKSSGNMSQSGQIALANQRMLQTANAVERVSNINTQIDNQAAYANQGYKMQGMQDTAANKGQALTNYYKALGATGQNAAMQRKDYLNRQMDQKRMDLLPQMFNNQYYNPTTGQWEFRQS